MQQITDDEFVAAWKKYGSPAKVAEALGLTVRNTYARRRRLEQRMGVELPSFGAIAPPKNTDKGGYYTVDEDSRNLRVDLTGTVVVFSDAHYWPGQVSEAHQAMVRLIKKLKPAAVIANGDVFDGARISRHEPMGWQQLPSVRQELEEGEARLAEIEKVCGNAKLYWCIGNHDLRFDRYIAQHAPELKALPGTRLADYFPRWKMCWSLHLNGNTVVKHSWHQGVHATYNNALKGGLNIVTGHLHRLQITAWGDYNGRRYGIDTGTLQAVNHEAFSYLQGNPTPWGSGFAVMTYDEDGMLLPPELVEVVQGRAYFRGAII